MSAGNGNPKFYNPTDSTYYDMATAGQDSIQNIADADDVSWATVADEEALVWVAGDSVFKGRPVVANTPLSPQILTGGALSAGTNNDTIKIGALTALLRDDTGATDTLVKISLAEQDNIAMAASDTKYHIVLQYNGNDPQIITQVATANGTTNIGIGTCLYEADHTIHWTTAGMRLSNGVAKLHRRAAQLREIELATGCTITDEGTSDFGIAAGTIYEGINAISFSAFDTNPAGGNDTFSYVSRDGAGWDYTDAQHDIDDSHYDDGTLPLGDITANQYSVHWVYIHPDDGHVYVVYGRDSYKLAAAEEAQPPGTLPLILSGFAVLIGKIIYKTGATASTTIQMVTDQFFTGTAVADIPTSPVFVDDVEVAYDAAQDFSDASYVEWTNSGMTFTLTATGRIMVWYHWYGNLDAARDPGVAAKVYLDGVGTLALDIQGFVGADDYHSGNLLWHSDELEADTYTVDVRVYCYNAADTYAGKELWGQGFVTY